MKRLISVFTLLIILGLGTKVMAQTEDTTLPSDVANVRVTPGPESLELEWDPAVDDTEVTAYKVYYGTRSVTADAGYYQHEVETEGPVTTYTLEDLIAGKEYFLAVTALDAAQNESKTYGAEVSATPEVDESKVEDETEPVAVIITDVTSGPAPIEVAFDGTASSYEDGEIIGYAWDFENDGEADSSEAQIIHTFETSGVYESTLTVQTEDDKTSTSKISIVVWEDEGEEVVEEEPAEEEPVTEEDPIEEIAEEIVEVAPVDVIATDVSYLAAEPGYDVTLAWGLPLGSENNAKYIVKINGEEHEVGADKTEYKLFLNGGRAYTATVYAETEEGVRSEGVELNFELPALPGTGPGLLIPFTAALLASAGVMRRKNK